MEFLDVFILILACILSYLLGNISIARLITKKSKDGNISSKGSGNPGSMNMLRNHGVVMGLFTLLCDSIKGAIPALFGYLYFGEMFGSTMAYITLYLFGFCAVLGHIFPVFYKFKGGKGIATTFGVFMVADYITTLILFVLLFIILYFIKIGSVVSILFITTGAIVQVFRPIMAGNWIAIAIMFIIVILDIYLHKTNLKRLIYEEENPADLQEAIKKDIQRLKHKK